MEEMVNEVVELESDEGKMPDEIRKTLETKKRVRETERQVSLQMRKLAEQEILKEAEKLSIRSRQPIDTALDLSKTSKKISFKAPTD
jgi:hypothetical protein